MQELPHPWGAYQRLQSALDEGSKVDSHSWGQEAELMRLLENPATYTEAIGSRWGATAARRERYQSLSRRKYSKDLEGPSIDIGAQVEAREALTLIQGRLSLSQWRVLLVAAHEEATAVADTAPAISKGALRTRVSRLRKELVEFRPAA